MLKALKKLFGRKEINWRDDPAELGWLSFGTVIIENGGAEGWLSSKWVKQTDGKYLCDGILVEPSYFRMPFAVVGKAPISQ